MAAAVITVAVGLAMVAACQVGSGSARIREASLVAPAKLSIGVATCNATLEPKVEELSDEVRIEMTYTGDTDDDCADGILVELTQPLGDRRLFDSVGQTYVVVNVP